MEDAHEELDWGAGDDDGAMAPREYIPNMQDQRHSDGDAEDEDAVSVGGDDYDMPPLQTYQTGGVQQRIASEQPLMAENKWRQDHETEVTEQAPGTPPHSLEGREVDREGNSLEFGANGNDDRYQRSSYRQDRGRTPARRSTLMPPPDRITHALPPKPIAASVVPPADNEPIRAPMRQQNPAAKPVSTRVERSERRPNGRSAETDDDLEDISSDREARNSRGTEASRSHHYSSRMRETTWDRSTNGAADDARGRGRQRTSSRSPERPHHEEFSFARNSDRSGYSSSRTRESDQASSAPGSNDGYSRGDRYYRPRGESSRDTRPGEYDYRTTDRHSQPQKRSEYVPSGMLVSAADAKTNRSRWGPAQATEEPRRFEPELETDRRWTPRGEDPPQSAVHSRRESAAPLARRGAYESSTGVSASRAPSNSYEDHSRDHNAPNDNPRWHAPSTFCLSSCCRSFLSPPPASVCIYSMVNLAPPGVIHVGELVCRVEKPRELSHDHVFGNRSLLAPPANYLGSLILLLVMLVFPARHVQCPYVCHILLFASFRAAISSKTSPAIYSETRLRT
jgi:hypothetical protein